MSPGPSLLHPSTVINSEPPLFSPGSSVGPTSLKDEGIRACQCDAMQTCIDNPVSPSSREVILCLLSQPQMFILSKRSIIIVLTQQGVANHPIITMDKAIDGNTTFRESGLRRRIIKTLVPEEFFVNPSENLLVVGIGTVLQTGSTKSRDVEFSITLALLSRSSDVPSESPSTSTKPTLDSPPTLYLPPSMMQTDDKILRLNHCHCDIRNACFPDQDHLTLTFTDRTIRICLRASPKTALLNVSTVVARGDKKVEFQVCSGQIDEPIDVGASANCWPLEGSFGVVIGTLSDDFFDVGAANSLFIVGVPTLMCPK